MAIAGPDPFDRLHPRRPKEETLPHLPATFGRERNDQELCREVAERRLSRDIRGYPVADDPSRDPAVLAWYREQFSFASVGARCRARLEELWAERERVGKRLRWRADRSPAGS